MKYKCIEYPNPSYGITLGSDIFDKTLKELRRRKILTRKLELWKGKKITQKLINEIFKNEIEYLEEEAFRQKLNKQDIGRAYIIVNELIRDCFEVTLE